MTNVDDTAARVDSAEPHLPVAPPLWLAILTWVMRAIVRIWVAAMVLAAAAFGGIAIYQYYQTRAELAEVRRAPGPESYAVIAYRRELERQIEEYNRDWRDRNAVPAPPGRPRLMEEIDLARQRNDELRRAAEQRRTVRGQGGFSAPQ